MATKVAQIPRPRHVPRRLCVACRQGDAKRALVRIVRTPAGSVQVDPSGKLSGRGAYLCAHRACWDLAIKKKIVEHALRAALKPEERAELVKFATTLDE